MLWSSLFVCLFGHLSCSVFSELPGSVVWCLTLIWQKFCHYMSDISSVLFSLLLLVFSLHIRYTFYSCLRYLVLFFSSLCPVCFSVFEDAINKSFNSELLSSVVFDLRTLSVCPSCSLSHLVWVQLPCFCLWLRILSAACVSSDTDPFIHFSWPISVLLSHGHLRLRIPPTSLSPGPTPALSTLYPIFVLDH